MPELERWTDDRLDDLALDVRLLLPLHGTVVVLSTKLDDARKDIGEMTDALKEAAKAEDLKALARALDRAQVSRQNRRTQLIHGVIAAVVGGIFTVLLTYAIAGGVVLR